MQTMMDRLAANTSGLSGPGVLPGDTQQDLLETRAGLGQNDRSATAGERATRAAPRSEPAAPMNGARRRRVGPAEVLDGDGHSAVLRLVVSGGY